MTTTIDETRLEEFMGQMVGHMTGAMVCFGVWLGDELGLYRAMDGAGAVSADEVAAATGCHPRLIREWLDGQAAAGLVEFDPDGDTYTLSAEGALALSDDTSPAFVARAMNAFGGIYHDLDKVATAFRGDGAIGWGEHHPCLFAGTEWFFRTGYRAELPAWIDALDGVGDKLTAGGTVADVGCGHGASAVVIAETYPAARVLGFDYHRPSVETATERAVEADVADRVRFEVAAADSFRGSYELICFFDCLHDMGDPVGVARHAREQLAPDGTVMLVEPFALDDRPANIAENPMAALLYAASSAVCTPNALSQDGGGSLGAQAGEERLRTVFAEAGYSHFRRVAETPMNLILEAKA